jgi:hypothetical protein
MKMNLFISYQQEKPVSKKPVFSFLLAREFLVSYQIKNYAGNMERGHRVWPG